MRKGTKRKTKDTAHLDNKPTEEPSQSPTKPAEENNHAAEPSSKAAGKGRAKRPKVAEPECFPEKWNLEDLWQQLTLVGTEWEELDMLYQCKWNFCNLEDALEEGGELFENTVFLFACTEPHFVYFQGRNKVILKPIVVAVASPFPPSDKMAIALVQKGEEIIPMKRMKFDWLPYIPPEKREAQVEKLKNLKIFILSCTRRRAVIKKMKIEELKEYEYCLPYFYNPLPEDELLQSTEVSIVFPMDPKPIISEFDWEVDRVEEYTNQLIEDEVLPADQKEPFKKFVKEKVRQAKKANREAREAREKALADMSDETRAAFENMKFYKFYPLPTADSPDVVKKLAYDIKLINYIEGQQSALIKNWLSSTDIMEKHTRLFEKHSRQQS